MNHILPKAIQDARSDLASNPIDVGELLKDVDLSEYDYLNGLTADKVRDQIYNSLCILDSISPDNVADLFGKLTQYRFVHSLNQLRRGRFIRWVPLLGTLEHKLSYGGMVVDIEITPECPMILCKTPVGKMVKFDFNRNLVYQKMTAEEKLIITIAAEL